MGCSRVNNYKWSITYIPSNGVMPKGKDGINLKKLQDFELYLVARYRKERTRKAYYSTTKEFLRFIRKEAHEIDNRDVQIWMGYLTRRTYHTIQ